MAPVHDCVLYLGMDSLTYIFLAVLLALPGAQQSGARAPHTVTITIAWTCQDTSKLNTINEREYLYVLSMHNTFI